jgi:hypothetical protein
MGVIRKIAVIAARHDPTTPFLTLDECRKLFIGDENSVFSYWSEQSENWFTFPGVDFYGPYDIALAAPPDSRNNIAKTARAAAVGVDLGAYDGVIVLLSPGKALAPDPNAPQQQTEQGYDAGALGLGAGSDAVLVAFETRTFFTHEVGHMLGFDHSWGLLNHGVDWNHTGATSNVYGDPYDIMSAQSFADSDPRFSLDSGETLTEFPGALTAGPAIARAVLHFYTPLAVETVGCVRHVNEGDSTIVSVNPAGSFQDGVAELLVWHPSQEDGAGRGRVYVEYRQFFEFASGTRWDQGLASSGDGVTRTGLVVHTIRNTTINNTPVVWYVGRICFPTAETDIVIDTDHGPVTISVEADQAGLAPPAFVNVQVGRSAVPRLWIKTSVTSPKVVFSSERRVAPGFSFMGTFTWERRGANVTETLTPLVSGLGPGSTTVADPVKIGWALDTTPVTDASGTVQLSKDGRQVTLAYTIDSAAQVLTLTSLAQDDAYSVVVTASVVAPVPPVPLSADTVFYAAPITEGWGDDYTRFINWFTQFTHPHPLPKFGPVDPGVLSSILQEVEQVSQLNPEVARNMGVIVRETVRQFAQQLPTQPTLNEPPLRAATISESVLAGVLKTDAL